MRKLISSVLLVVVASILLAFNTTSKPEIKQSILSENEIKLAKFRSYFKIYIKTEIKKQEEIIVVEEIVEPQVRPYISGIGLSDNILDYIWEVSIENELSYELILAFARVESNFKVDARSKTSDSGLMQINDNTKKWIAKELGLTNYNLMDAKTSVDFCVWYLTYLRDYYRGFDLSEEDVFYYTVSSYNMGQTGAKNYIKKYGFNVKYTEKIIHYKELYESGGVID